MKVTSTDIKNSFGKYLRLCANEPVYITKNGETIAKLVQDHQIEGGTQDDFQDDFHHGSYDGGICAEQAHVYNVQAQRMGYGEFLKMNATSANRYEYIDGVVYLLSSPTVFHQRVISRLHVHFDRYLEGMECDSFMAPFDVFLKKKNGNYKENVVQPDLLIACKWRNDVDEKGKYRGTPRLVVEVLSPSGGNKEMFKKLNLYRETGIEEYWIIDPESGGALVYHFALDQICETRCFNGDQTIESIIYPGLRFRVLE